MRDRHRSWLMYGVVLVVLWVAAMAFLFGLVIQREQAKQAQHAERQRQAICAILANIPGHIPPEIAHARLVFARPGHRDDCQPIHQSTAHAAPTPTVTRTSVVLIPGATSHRPMPAASPRPTSRRSPSPKATSSATPTPSPTPSRTLCIPLITC